MTTKLTYLERLFQLRDILEKTQLSERCQRDADYEINAILSEGIR